MDTIQQPSAQQLDSCIGKGHGRSEAYDYDKGENRKRAAEQGNDEVNAKRLKRNQQEKHRFNRICGLINELNSMLQDAGINIDRPTKHRVLEETISYIQDLKRTIQLHRVSPETLPPPPPPRLNTVTSITLQRQLSRSSSLDSSSFMDENELHVSPQSVSRFARRPSPPPPPPPPPSSIPAQLVDRGLVPAKMQPSVLGRVSLADAAGLLADADRTNKLADQTAALKKLLLHHRQSQQQQARCQPKAVADLTGHFCWASPEFVERTMMSANDDDLRKTSLLQLVHSDDVKQAYQDLCKVLISGQGQFTARTKNEKHHPAAKTAAGNRKDPTEGFFCKDRSDDVLRVSVVQDKKGNPVKFCVELLVS